MSRCDVVLNQIINVTGICLRSIQFESVVGLLVLKLPFCSKIHMTYMSFLLFQMLGCDMLSNPHTSSGFCHTIFIEVVPIRILNNDEESIYSWRPAQTIL